MKYKAHETSYMHELGSCGCSNEKSHCYSKPYYVNEDYHYEKPKCKGDKEMGSYGDYYREDYYKEDCRKRDHKDDCCKRDHKDDCCKRDHKDDCCKKDCHEKCDCCCTTGIVKELKKLEGETVVLLIGPNPVFATLISVNCDIAKIILLATDIPTAPVTEPLNILSSISVCEINGVAKFTPPAA
ncbi:hypothetical protein CSE16_06110 [Solibacillus sp. R5-41]|uniref:hypothetical protein n=1 Tax=Solibacillus sp. R5-41 TaxID=2048654 RepID=UPI000C1264F5|nr:hypothetical protein [Solibacillus sp. R5-41]ATP39658.1 hypothetical protein CSE16_06110 [Solibacillus sp. R5-41]